MSDELGNNLLNPGDTPHDNVQFLVFCAAVLRAVNKFQGLLRFSIASAGNDHRLGANEAPPAIISIFLGDMLTDIFQQIEKAGSAKTTKSGGIMDIGVNVLPKLPRDAGDRNRTSPFAFTGNKFEFRAVSSNQSIALPNVCLNVAVTESLDYCATELEKQLKEGKKLQAAVKTLLTKLIKDNKRIIFNGNGYADEWQKEAAQARPAQPPHVGRRLRRGAQARRRQGVREVRRAQRARAARALRGRASSSTTRRVNIEAQLMVLMANRYILPAGYRYQGAARARASPRSRRPARPRRKRSARSTRLTRLTDECKIRVDQLQDLLEHEADGNAEKHAKYFRDKVIPAMNALRDVGDPLEGIVPHDDLAAADLPGDVVREVTGHRPTWNRKPPSKLTGRRFLMCRSAALAGPSLALAAGPDRPIAQIPSRRVDLEAADCSRINHDVRRLRSRPGDAARHGPAGGAARSSCVPTPTAASASSAASGQRLRDHRLHRRRRANAARSAGRGR